MGSTGLSAGGTTDIKGVGGMGSTGQALSADEVLACTDLQRERIDLGTRGFVYVRGMTGKERDAWEASLMRGKGSDRRADTRNARARLAVRCLVDEANVRLFTDSDAELIEATGCDLGNRSAHARFLLRYEIVDRLPVDRAPRIVRPRRWRHVAQRVLAEATGSRASLRTAARAHLTLI